MTTLLPALFLSALTTAAFAQPPARGTGGESAVTVAPGDYLRISVWPDSVLSGRFLVEDNGTVALPELGEMKVVGIDIREIRATLRNLYGRVRKNSVVSVRPIFRIGVLGQVQRPGLYDVEATMTWFDVISMAGGFTSAAARDQLLVIRDGEEIHVNAVANDLSAISSLSVQARSGDKLIVPERTQHNYGLVLGIAQTIAVLVTIALQLRR